MRGVESSRCLGQQLDGALGVECAVAREDLLEISAVDVAHDDEQRAVVGLSGFVDRNHVRVIDRGRETTLEAKALPERLVLGKLSGK